MADLRKRCNDFFLERLERGEEGEKELGSKTGEERKIKKE